MKTLTPGQPIPEEGKIYTEKYRELIETETAEAKAKAVSAIDREHEKIQKEMTEAPSEEAARAVQAFVVRAVDKEIEDSAQRNKYADEVDGLMNAWGSNYLSYQALKHYAEVAGVKDFKEHETQKKLEALQRIETLVNETFNAYSVVSNGLSEDGKGELKFVLANI